MPFTNKDIQLINCCVSNYIETANSQIDNLTVGTDDCATLLDFYQNRVTQCYDLQKKLNALLLTPNTQLT